MIADDFYENHRKLRDQKQERNEKAGFFIKNHKHDDADVCKRGNRARQAGQRHFHAGNRQNCLRLCHHCGNDIGEQIKRYKCDKTCERHPSGSRHQFLCFPVFFFILFIFRLCHEISPLFTDTVAPGVRHSTVLCLHTYSRLRCALRRGYRSRIPQNSCRPRS